LNNISSQLEIGYKIIGESIVFGRDKGKFTEMKGVTLSGIIVDNHNRTPIAYGAIGLVGTFSGTITNEEGWFDFYVRSPDPDDSIFVSMLGYKYWTTSISEFLRRGDTIGLEPGTILLDEIVIMDQAPSAKEIMQRVVDELRDNYVTTTITMDGFYRNYFKVNGKYVSLLEAAVVIEGGNIRKDIMKDKIFVRKIRSNKGLEKTNSLFRESDENFLKTLLVNDLIRSGTRKKSSIGSILNYESNQYVLDTISTYKDRLVYVVTCQFDEPVYEVSLTPHINSRFKFFVDADCYAIIRIERESDFEKGRNPWELGENEDLSYNMVYNKFVQEFKSVDDKMYLSYFSSLLRFDIIEVNSNQRSGEEELVRELFINDIAKGRQKEFNWHEQMKLNSSLEEKFTDYDTAFWANYNMIRRSPLRDQILKDLEEGDSLETQFTMKIPQASGKN